MDLDTVLAVDPFANLIPLLILWRSTLHIFFVIWFRACTRVRWAAFVRSAISVRIN